MKKFILIILGLIVFAILAVALAGMYKFNYLANQPGYDPDGNKIDITRDYVGATIYEATEISDAKGMPFRVVMEDGQPLPVTKDYRPGRINATAENGIVVSYDVEGGAIVYNSTSWRTMIPESCQSFYNGCNTCWREAVGITSCTEKDCDTYEKPVCND